MNINYLSDFICWNITQKFLCGDQFLKMFLGGEKLINIYFGGEQLHSIVLGGEHYSAHF